MAATQATADEQFKLWNGPAGEAWVDGQELLDRMFEPFEGGLLEALADSSRGRVLDVGCGTGKTTLVLAGHASAPHCTGIDISEPMLARARSREKREGLDVNFIRADAQTHPFEPASFDAIVSRFGVMFFDDSVAAFSNLRRSAAEHGRLRFIAWRSPAENPFMTAAERAVAPLLPNLPARKADGPGQFAFADQSKVRNILERSGWSQIEIRPIDIACTFPERDLVRYLTRLGPLGLALPTLDEATRGRVIDVARAAVDPYVYGSEVRYTAACWVVDARA